MQRRHDMMAQNIWAERARTCTISIWAILRESKPTTDSRAGSERFVDFLAVSYFLLEDVGESKA